MRHNVMTANALSFATGLIFSGAVFAFDYQTTQRFSFYLLYFPSLILCAWYARKFYAYALVGICFVLWSIARARLYPDELTPVFYTNAVVRLITFWLVVFFSREVRRRTHIIEEQAIELKRSNEELDNFAAKAAHDLQTPLTIFQSALEFIKEKDQKVFSADERSYLEMMSDAVARMAELIKNLLIYARVRKETQLDEAVDTSTLLQETRNFFQLSIEKKRAVITCDPLPVIKGNKSLFGQLFENLIANSLKYCEKEPRLHISAVRKKNDWIFSFQDNGIGISPADQKRVFVMFERLLSHAKYPGTGIGLATCQKIVERYGGSIWVEPNPTGGSIFKFTVKGGASS